MSSEKFVPIPGTVTEKDFRKKPIEAGLADFFSLGGNFAVDFYQNFNSQGRWIRLVSVSILPVTTFFIGLFILAFQNRIIAMGNSVTSLKAKQ